MKIRKGNSKINSNLAAIARNKDTATMGHVLTSNGDGTSEFKAPTASAASAAEISWSGKTINAFGDSITWYDGQTYLNTHTEEGQTCVGYQSYMRSQLGCTVNNFGVAGYEMSEVTAYIKTKDYTNIDAVTIMCGANDFKDNSANLGAISAIGSTHDTTYYGSLQEAVEYLLGVKPSIKIILITPIKGWIGETMEPIPETYPNAMIDVANLYSIGLCDLYHLSGINLVNYATYMGDIVANGYYLHPNNAGYARMGEIIVSYMATGYDSTAPTKTSSSSGALVATYTHTLNAEIVVSAVDDATDTFTSATHGLVDGDIVAPTLNAVTGAASMPLAVYAGGLVAGQYYVGVDGTDPTNKFQLYTDAARTAMLDVTANATIDLTKWHFEKRTNTTTNVDIDFTGLPAAKKYHVRLKGILSSTGGISIITNLNYLSELRQASNAAYKGESIYLTGVNCMFCFDYYIETDGIVVSRKIGSSAPINVSDATKIGTVEAFNVTSMSNTSVLLDTNITSFKFRVTKPMMLLNGTKIDVYSV